MNDDAQTIWQTHSIKFLESAFRTDRQETLHQADGRGRHSIDCGDSLEIFVLVKDQQVDSISYATNGCINTNACANAVIDLAQGKTIEQALRVSAPDVAAYLESLPQDHFHCAELAVTALRKAIGDLRRNEQTPWKKAYR